MYSNNLLQERKKIYKNLKNLKLHNNQGLIFYNEFLYEDQINFLVKLYLKENIKYFFNKKFLSLSKSVNLISRLPNLTPNGILRPVQKTQLVYNLITKLLFNSLHDLGIKFEAAEFPTIRIKTNKFNHNRPYATTKLHSDAWVGQYGDAIVSFGIEGDFTNNGVEFFLPQYVSNDFFSKIDNYDLGLDKFRKLKYVGKLKKGFFFIFDQSVLHKTVTRKNCKPRISIDFGIKMKLKNKTNIKKGDTKRYNYMDIKNFENIGKNSLIFITEFKDYKKNIQEFIKF